MSYGNRESPLRPALLVPLLLCACLFSVSLTKIGLWTPGEPRYAEVAREMLDRGGWLPPFCNGQPYAEKPPLFFWTVMLGAKAFGGVNQLAGDDAAVQPERLQASRKCST